MSNETRTWWIDERHKNAPYWPAFGVTDGKTTFWVQTAQDANVASAALNNLEQQLKTALEELDERRDAIRQLVRDQQTALEKAVDCVLIEEKHKNENYILYVCDCSPSNPAKRADCPFYALLTNPVGKEGSGGAPTEETNG